jgi:hypothetical protein
MEVVSDTNGIGENWVGATQNQFLALSNLVKDDVSLAKEVTRRRGKLLVSRLDHRNTSHAL